MKTSFREHGCHFIIACGKTNVSRPLAIAKALEIPAFVIFDSDAHKESDDDRKRNSKANSCILALCGHSDQDPLPNEDVFLPPLVMWRSTIGDAVKREIGQQKWDEAYRTVRDELRLDVDQKLCSKNSHVISATLEQLWKQDSKSQKLDQLCDQILSFASNETVTTSYLKFSIARTTLSAPRISSASWASD